MILRQRKLRDPFFILTETSLKDILANASTLLQALLHEDSKRAVYELCIGIASHIQINPKDTKEVPIDTT